MHDKTQTDPMSMTLDELRISLWMNSEILTENNRRISNLHRSIVALYILVGLLSAVCVFLMATK